MSTHSIPVSVRVSHGARTPSIAPSFPQSLADKAAHSAASYGRPGRVQDGDSDPDMDEALRRVQTNLAYLQRDQQLAEIVAAEVRMGAAA
jgi:hypothetical protein